MALEGPQTTEPLGNDPYSKVTFAIACAGMTRMEMALIDDLELKWVERTLEQLANSTDASQRLSSFAASFWERRIDIQMACAITVRIVNPIVPAVLKTTQVSMS